MKGSSVTWGGGRTEEFLNGMGGLGMRWNRREGCNIWTFARKVAGFNPKRPIGAVEGYHEETSELLPQEITTHAPLAQLH